jgi:hypothetical protein
VVYTSSCATVVCATVAFPKVETFVVVDGFCGIFRATTSKGFVVPQVGNKKFPYTAAGMKAAEAAAKKSNKSKMTTSMKKKKA